MADDALAPAAHRLLTEMSLVEDGDELICEGVLCFIGSRRVSRATVNSLLRLLLISNLDYGSGAEYFGINDTGRSALRRPELIGEIVKALQQRKPFTVENDRVVLL